MKQTTIQTDSECLGLIRLFCVKERIKQQDFIKLLLEGNIDFKKLRNHINTSREF